MSVFTPIANEITLSGSGVDSSQDCSLVLTLIVKESELYLDRYVFQKLLSYICLSVYVKIL